MCCARFTVNVIFQELDDSAIQEKIDHEVHIRDGIVKLLAACHEEVQALEASKSLLTINARILALMGLLQRHRAKSVMRRKGSRYTLHSLNNCH